MAAERGLGEKRLVSPDIFFAGIFYIVFFSGFSVMVGDFFGKFLIRDELLESGRKGCGIVGLKQESIEGVLDKASLNSSVTGY